MSIEFILNRSSLFLRNNIIFVSSIENAITTGLSIGTQRVYIQIGANRSQVLISHIINREEVKGEAIYLVSN